MAALVPSARYVHLTVAFRYAAQFPGGTAALGYLDPALFYPRFVQGKGFRRHLGPIPVHGRGKRRTRADLARPEVPPLLTRARHAGLSGVAGRWFS